MAFVGCTNVWLCEFCGINSVPDAVELSGWCYPGEMTMIVMILAEYSSLLVCTLKSIFAISYSTRFRSSSATLHFTRKFAFALLVTWFIHNCHLFYNFCNPWYIFAPTLFNSILLIKVFLHITQLTRLTNWMITNDFCFFFTKWLHWYKNSREMEDLFFISHLRQFSTCSQLYGWKNVREKINISQEVENESQIANYRHLTTV